MKDYTFDGYNGLAVKQQPLLAATNTIFLLKCHWQAFRATAGFFAKYYMLVAAVKNGTLFMAGDFCCACVQP